MSKDPAPQPKSRDAAPLYVLDNVFLYHQIACQTAQLFDALADAIAERVIARLEASQKHANNWLHADQTKGKVARTLPIYGDMELWLRRQQKTATGNPYVFHGKRGFPVDDHLIGWSEACGRVGPPGLVLHDMRRSGVRNLKRARGKSFRNTSLSAKPSGGRSCGGSKAIEAPGVSTKSPKIPG